MSFLDLAQRRESVRAYTDRPVGRQQIDRCLEAARLAPSACNSQPWHFIVVDDPAIRAQLASHLRDAVMNHFVTTAPVLIVVVAETPSLIPRLAGYVKDKPYYLMDIGMAVEHFCLQATDDGLGTCILGWFDEPAVKKLLSIPKSKRVPLAITLGYPQNPVSRPKQRKPADEIRSYNAYHAPPPSRPANMP
jgi:nitroreductase